MFEGPQKQNALEDDMTLRSNKEILFFSFWKENVCFIFSSVKEAEALDNAEPMS